MWKILPLPRRVASVVVRGEWNINKEINKELPKENGQRLLIHSWL